LRTPRVPGKGWRLVRARYRIGTTSFVHPAGWLENARRLADRVRDVEILLFEAPAPGSPAPEEIAGLARLAAGTGLTYTLHTPLAVSVASEDEARRAAGVAAIVRAVEVAAPLAPHAVVAHLYLGEGEGGPRPRDLHAWRRRAESSLGEIVRATGLAPDRLCLETLDYDFALAEPVVEALGLSVALDAGHLARDGVPFDAVLARNLARTRVIQWHGTEPGGRDHRSLRHHPRADAVRLVRTLVAAGWDGVLTLEVFRAADLDDSLAVLAELEAEAFAELEAT
jgi:sugar phosphate isomerase/epimerase